MTQVVVNGNTYSDDGTAVKDMRDGGHRSWLLPMITDTMVTINSWLGTSFVTGIRTVTGTGAQTVANADHVIKWVPATPAPVTFTLPAVPGLGQRHQFMNRQPNVGQIHPLTVVPTTGTINGRTQAVINAPYSVLRLVHTGANDWGVEETPGSPNPAPNLLINSGMNIDQEFEGAAVTLTSSARRYPADCWQAIYVSATAAGITAQRVLEGPFDNSYSIKFTVGTGSAVAATDYMRFFQIIEGAELLTSGVGTVQTIPPVFYLSFWVRSSIAPYTACGQIGSNSAVRYFPFNFTILAANTWEHKVCAIPLDTTAAWTSGIVSICCAGGTNTQAAANTWTGLNRFATSAITNSILTTSGATFQITNCKLEYGFAPSPYRSISLNEEMIRCQRYYEKSYDAVVPGTVSNNGAFQLRAATGGTPAGSYIRYMNNKRAVPVVTYYSNVTGTAARVRDVVGAVDIIPTTVNSGLSGFSWTAPPAGANTQITGHWVADIRY